MYLSLISFQTQNQFAAMRRVFYSKPPLVTLPPLGKTCRERQESSVSRGEPLIPREGLGFPAECTGTEYKKALAHAVREQDYSGSLERAVATQGLAFSRYFSPGASTKTPASDGEPSLLLLLYLLPAETVGRDRSPASRNASR